VKYIFFPEKMNEGDQVEEQNAFSLLSDSFLEIVTDQLRMKNLSKSWLANKLNVSAPAVSKLLVRCTNPTLKTIADVADALNITIELKFDVKNDLLKKINAEIGDKKAQR